MNQRRGFLLFIIGIASAITFLMLSPFLGYLLAAVILGFITHPFKQRLSSHMRGGLAAGVVILVTILAAILPVVVIAGGVAGDASQLVDQLDTGSFTVLQQLEAQIEAVLGQDLEIHERIKSLLRTAANRVAASASNIVSFAASVAIGLSVMLFVQYYVVRDGHRFVAWTKDFDVLPTDLQEDLYSSVALSTHAVIKGHVLVAILQGMIAGIGLFATGIPNAFFWTFVMTLLGFIPLIGTSLVWAPAAAYLFVTGEPVMSIALAAYGIIVVGATDNFARPLLVDKEADIHEVFILLGVVGGVAVFGAIGIFIGPIMFGILKEVLEIYREHYPAL